jgi:hypothetical protein
MNLNALVLAALILALVELFLFHYELGAGNVPGYVTRLN